MASGPHHFMANIDGETVETVRDFILGGSKITADGDCSNEIKRCLLLGRKTMANLDSILKSTDITLPTKVRLVKAVVFPVVMYRCESWTIKKGEDWRIDAFELWCWRRLFRVPWTTSRSNQSILNEISPEYSLEGLMLKLKFQYFAYLIWRTDSFAKTLMLEKTEGRRRRGWQRWDRWMASLTRWTCVWVGSKNWWWTVKPGVLQSMGLQRVRRNWSGWTELNWFLIIVNTTVNQSSGPSQKQMYSRLLVLCHLLNSVSLGAIVILHPGWLKDPCSFLHIHCLLTLKLLASDESIVSRAYMWRAPPLQPISHHTATQVFCTTSFQSPISQDSLLSPLHVVSLPPGVPLPPFSPGNEAPSHSGKHHLLWDLLTSKNKKRTLTSSVLW